MILSIESSDPRFKSIHFHAGLNVLLSDAMPESTAKQTRNSAGKTSIVEIIHFLCGADSIGIFFQSAPSLNTCFEEHF